MSLAATVPRADPGDTNASELTAERLSVRFQGLAAISDVSLTVRRHEVFGLIGPNGAGKTTLVNCLTGFQAPTRGARAGGPRRDGSAGRRCASASAAWPGRSRPAASSRR